MSAILLDDDYYNILLEGKFVANLPASVKADIDTFIELLENEPFDDNSLKNYGLKNQEVIGVLKRVFE